MNKLQLMQNESIGKLILRLSPPIMFSLLIQALYNIVDSIFIARFSESALTAMSIVFPIQLLMTALATGTGVGINTLVSRFYGESNKKAASAVARHGILLGIINWFLFTVISLLLINPYFLISSKSTAVISDGVTYSFITLFFSLGIFMESNCTKILQAAGSMVIPMTAHITGAVINTILDPILIFGMLGFPVLGVKGAAVATVIGQLVAMIITLKAVCKSGILISFKWKVDFYIIKEIYKSGFPSIVMQSLYTIYIVGLNLILGMFTENAVTVLGIYYKSLTVFQ
jgi:putative MATE family efflux protein